MAAEKTIVKGCRLRQAEVERMRNLLYNFPELKDESGVLYQAALRGMLLLEVQATRPGGMRYGGMSEDELADALLKRLMPAIDFLYDGGYLPPRYSSGVPKLATSSIGVIEVEVVETAAEAHRLIVIDPEAASDIEGLGGDFME